MEAKAEKKRIEVDINKFKCIKILLESGTPYEEITNMTGASRATIARVKSAQTFDEYKHNARAAAACYSISVRKKIEEEERKRIEQQKTEQKESEEKKPADEKNTPAFIPASSYQINRLIEIMKDQNEILKIMSNKIAFIVDELTK